MSTNRLVAKASHMDKPFVSGLGIKVLLKDPMNHMEPVEITGHILRIPEEPGN